MLKATGSIDRNERDADPQPQERRLSELLLRADHRISFEMILQDEDLDTDAIREVNERICKYEVSEHIPESDYAAYTPENHAQALREQMTAWAFHCGAKSELWRDAGGDTLLLIRLMERGVLPIDRVPVTEAGWRRYYQYCRDVTGEGGRPAQVPSELGIHYSKNDLGLARLLCRHYLWNYTGEPKGRERIDVNRAADALAPGLAAWFAGLDGERLGDIERHMLSNVLVAERTRIRELGAVPLASRFIFRMVADKLLPRLEWDERSHGMASRDEIYGRLHDACRLDVDRPIVAGIRASVCAERLIESNRRLLNEMADEAVQATEPAPAT